MLLVNTDYISGKELKMLGMVSGAVVKKTTSEFGGQSRSLKAINGNPMDEKKKKDEEINDVRNEASIKMVKAAQKQGADAIINIRYTAAAISSDSYEVMMYGTAVKFVR